jgi:hypothetical protein
MDRVVPDSERISCEDLHEFVQRFPEVARCFKWCDKKHEQSIRKITAACKKLRSANNNLHVLK